MGVRPMLSGLMVCGLSISAVDLVGCARHADFIQARNQLSAVARSQEQDRQRMDAVMRRLEAIEKIKDPEANKPRFDELSARFQKMEHRLAKLEETASRSAVKVDPPTESRPVKPVKSTPPAESIAIVTGITPTSAFNLAYNDYLTRDITDSQRTVLDGRIVLQFERLWTGDSNIRFACGRVPWKRKGAGCAVQTWIGHGRDRRSGEVQKKSEASPRGVSLIGGIETSQE